MAGAVLLFGRLKDAFGASSIEMPEGVGTAAELRAMLDISTLIWRTC